jgi:hypothetical protein
MNETHDRKDERGVKEIGLTMKRNGHDGKNDNIFFMLPVRIARYR